MTATHSALGLLSVGLPVRAWTGLAMLAGYGIILAPVLGRWLSVLAVVALSLFPIVFRYFLWPLLLQLF